VFAVVQRILRQTLEMTVLPRRTVGRVHGREASPTSSDVPYPFGEIEHDVIGSKESGSSVLVSAWVALVEDRFGSQAEFLPFLGPRPLCLGKRTSKAPGRTSATGQKATSSVPVIGQPLTERP